MNSTHRVGGYTPSENNILFRHRLVRDFTPHPGVIFLTGSTSDATQSFIFAPMRDAWKAVTDLGIDVLVIDGGGQTTWGNDTAINAITAAVAYARTKGISGPLVVGGYSMGGMDSMNWISRNLSEVKGFMGFAPASDLTYHEANTHKTAIDAAYGGNYAVNGAGHDPIRDLTGALSTKPWKAWYATDDTVVPRSTVEALASAVGGSLVPLTGDHVNFWNNVVPADVANYVGGLLL